MSSEQEREFRRLHNEFRTLQRLLSYEGSFESIKQATVCAGLAEVCEMFADQIKRRARYPRRAYIQVG